ncbi:hypothetical protein AWL63_00860 [Sphingomonas panacis]|uniref:DUF721 domain-containing protein n=1 Tax=Sphingomonas panacis TaxID=1560345 RepID=A0A1B3Z5P4_9SPHN|nr:DciA family protein [Sphingomonas panacis]AOH82744.1 hypothetical protein AWL63_00860 [Sphingomonas panacis]
MDCAMSKRRPPAEPAPAPRRGGGARAVSELLPDATRTAFRRFGFVQSAVVTRWGEIVGSRYAGVSAPESIKFPMGERTGGTLNLVVRGAHATMMQHIAPEIVERVNRFFGYEAVARVLIRQGDVPAPRPRAAPPSLKPVPVELGASLRTIADPELKAVLEALAAGVAATRGAPAVGKGEE